MKGKSLKALVVSLIAALLIFIPVMAAPQTAEAATISPQVTYRTQAEISKYYKEKGIDFKAKITYSKSPQKNNVVGALSNETQKSALKALNYIRYIVGISDNISLNYSFAEETQAGTYLNDLIRATDYLYLSHSPYQPSGIKNNIYLLGKSGASSSNLSSDSVVNRALINWMHEKNNKTQSLPLGHRMHIIDPRMTETAFGSSNIGGGCSAMYVFGKKNL